MDGRKRKIWIYVAGSGLIVSFVILAIMSWNINGNVIKAILFDRIPARPHPAESARDLP